MNAVITKEGAWLRIKANDAMIAGLPCGDSTIQFSHITKIDKFMNNVAINIDDSEKIVLEIGKVASIGGDMDLDSTMKIRNALMNLVTT